MQVRALDANNDWIFGKGKQSYKQDKAALNQKIITRLHSWRTDCFFAPGEGVDWNNYLDIGTKRLLDIDIAQYVNKTGGVLSIADYKSNITPERVLRVSFTARTIYGPVDVSEVSNA